MEKKQSSQKVKAFFKKNIYYIIMAACLIAIAAMITVTVLLNDNENSINNKLDNTQVVDNTDVTPIADPDDGKNDVTPIGDISDGGGETPTGGEETPTGGDDTPTGGDDTPIVEPITFDSPVVTIDILKDYSMDALVWNSTLRHYAVHNGIDFGGEEGTNVLCVCDGVITSVGYDILTGYTVTVQHNDTLFTSYGSLNEPTVKVGQTVKRGDVLGTMGVSAGNEYSMGPHLHFSVMENKKYTDPYQYMTIGGK